MELIEVILSDENLKEAIKRVKSNKGVPGIDKMTVNEIDKYFEENKDYAKTILQHFNTCISDDGQMNFSTLAGESVYFLDWPTNGTNDAMIGTAAIIMIAAKRFLEMEENEICHAIIQKLSMYLDVHCEFKQTRAFQILAGRNAEGRLYHHLSSDVTNSF